MKHKSIPKKIREQVYQKYDGHCGYCGCELEYKKMQVDHIESVYAHDGADSLENFMPACRMCNFYKSTFTIEKFRENLQTIKDRLAKNFIYKLAIKYNLIAENDKPIVFYFEKCDKKKNSN